MTMEYLVIDHAWGELQDRLNEHGKEGWIVVHTEEHGPGRVLLILMRQVFTRVTSPEEYFGPDGPVNYAS